MSDKTVEILEQNKSVSITEDGSTVIIDSAALSVVSVGTQGPAGPNKLGGKNVTNDTVSDGDLLRYSSTSDVWEFTQEIDAGTY